MSFFNSRGGLGTTTYEPTFRTTETVPNEEISTNRFTQTYIKTLKLDSHEPKNVLHEIAFAPRSS